MNWQMRIRTPCDTTSAAAQTTENNIEISNTAESETETESESESE